MHNRLLFTAIIVAVFSCGDSRNSPADSFSVDSVNVVATPKVHYDTIFSFSVYGDAEIQLYRNDTLVRSLDYNKADADTTFYGDGCIETITKRGFRDYEEKYYVYDHDKLLRREYTLYDHDGLGGTDGLEVIYDSLGRLLIETYNKDYLPDDTHGHLKICGTVTTKYYYPNGKLDSVTQADVHYEGLGYCPCGTWKYYDTIGKLIRTVKYKKCGDGKTDCEQM